MLASPRPPRPPRARLLHPLAPLVVAFALLCVLGWSPPAAASTPRRFEGDPIGVVEVTLDNGLTVLMSENHARAEVFGAVIVRAGGKNDPAAHTGIAHYLEHMLFKGTQQLGTLDYAQESKHLQRIEALYAELASAGDDEDARARLEQEIDAAAQEAAKWAVPNEIDHLLAEIGGTGINAFTTYDVTAYYNLLPASQLETWLEIYSHRFEQPVFRLFPSELEAVYEEKNRSMDGYMEPAFEAFIKAMFPGHPYGEQPVLGTVEHLKRPSLGQMRAFYERYYVASNMALVLAGDFDPEAVLPMIEAKFGDWRTGEPANLELPPIQKFGGRQVVTERVTPIRAEALAFLTPGQGHEDYPALLIAERILSNEDGAGTLDRLSEDGKLLVAMPIPLGFHDQDGIVFLTIPRVVTQTFRGAERLVRRAIDDVRAGRSTPAQLEAARENLLREHELTWESNEERALAMGDTWARRQSWGAYLKMLEGIHSATAADVAKAADRWLGDDYLLFRSRMGRVKGAKLDKPDFTAVAPKGEARSEYWKSLHPLPGGAPKPRFVSPTRDLTRLAVTKGVGLVAAANPFNDIYRLEIRYGVGHHALPQLQRLAQWLPRVGSEHRDADAMAQALYAIATTLEMESTPEELVVRLEGPQRHMASALALLRELGEGPDRDRRRLRVVRREAWALERLDRREPSSVADALYEHALYDARSMYRQRGIKALRRYSVRDLQAAWSQARRHEATVHYVGRMAPEGVAKMVREGLSFVPDPLAAVPKVYRTRKAFESDAVFFVPQRGAVQTQLTFFIEGDPIPVAEVPAMQAFDEYLGGSMGGLIFQEVREFRALAYSAHGGWYEPTIANRPGIVWARIGCQADKTEDALAVMTGMLRDLPRKPARMEAVRSALARSQETADPEFRELPQAVQAWAWRGYATDPRRLRMRQYAGLRWEDLQGFWERRVKGRPLVLMVVGDPKRIDEDVLERYGPVTRVSEGTLYRP